MKKYTAVFVPHYLMNAYLRNHTIDDIRPLIDNAMTHIDTELIEECERTQLFPMIPDGKKPEEMGNVGYGRYIRGVIFKSIMNDMEGNEE